MKLRKCREAGIGQKSQLARESDLPGEREVIQRFVEGEGRVERKREKGDGDCCCRETDASQPVLETACKPHALRAPHACSDTNEQCRRRRERSREREKEKELRRDRQSECRTYRPGLPFQEERADTGGD